MREVSALVSIGIAAFMLLLAECGKNSSPVDSGETTGPLGADGGGSVGPLDGGPGTDGSGAFPDSGATEAGGVAVDVSITEGVDAPSGCGVAGAPTGVFSNQTITIGDQARTYVLSVPRSYDPSTPLGLVFGWHGHGGTGYQARQSYAIEPSAASSAIFVYPDGITNGADWDYSPTGIDVALFDALVANLAGSYCIDRNRIFSTGLSVVPTSPTCSAAVAATCCAPSRPWPADCPAHQPAPAMSARGSRTLPTTRSSTSPQAALPRATSGSAGTVARPRSRRWR